MRKHEIKDGIWVFDLNNRMGRVPFIDISNSGEGTNIQINENLSFTKPINFEKLIKHEKYAVEYMSGAERRKLLYFGGVICLLPYNFLLVIL